MVRDNKLIGNFTLAGIPPAPKGVPQIEVTFDIDADGIINVSARDKATNKDSSITVAGSSGLSENEIEQMVNDAEKFKSQDEARKQAIETANKADQLANDTENSLKEFEGKVDKAEAQKVRDQITSLKELVARVQGGEEVNAEELKTKTEELQTSSMKLFEQLYKNDSNNNNNNNNGNNAESGETKQ